MRSVGNFTHHAPCESCGSSDAVSVFDNGDRHCFSCGKHISGSSGDHQPEARRISRQPRPLIEGLEYRGLPKRALTEETCRKWGYGARDGEHPVQVAAYRAADGTVVAQKVRAPGKEFSWRGDHSKAGLFGQHLWGDGGKMLIITEGEIDAMSVSQVQNHKWPVVSIPDGAQSAEKAIRKNIEWLERFERVVFMFDADDPGRKAAAECAQLLSPGRAFIAELPLKDANDMLRAGRGAEIVSAGWNARPYRPDGIVSGKDCWDQTNDFSTFASIPYPWPGLNKLTRGVRRGEVVVFTGGTGIGKSEVVRQAVAHFHDAHKETIGCLFLEESVQRTCLGLMGLHLGRQLHIDPTLASEAERREAFDATVGSGRYYLFDHFGSMSIEQVLSRIRYMAVGLGCTTIVLDHISIVVSGSEIDDERKALDVLVTRLKSLAMECKLNLFLLCHLKKKDGTPYEEGGRVTLQDFRGTGGIAQVANIAIALERNPQDEDPKTANRTCMRVLKNRHTGEQGVAGYLEYDRSTGRLTEVEHTESAPSGAAPDNVEFA